MLALLVGVLLAVGRLSEHRWSGSPPSRSSSSSAAYPCCMLIFFFYLGLPRPRVDLPGALVIGLTLYNGAVLAEIFRAGILSVPRGQTRGRVRPRAQLLAGRCIHPGAAGGPADAAGPRSASCVTLLKDTSLGFIVTYVELVRPAG